jgi:hypothetical protein
MMVDVIIPILMFIGIICVMFGSIGLCYGIDDSESADVVRGVICIILGSAICMGSLFICKTEACHCDSTCGTCNEDTQ